MSCPPCPAENFPVWVCPLVPSPGGLFSYPYSLKCLEEGFSEVRLCAFCSFVRNPSRTSSSESEPPRFQDPWRSPELEDIDDVGRVHGDVRGNGMVGPQVHPGVTRPQGQDRLDHARAEVLEH